MKVLVINCGSSSLKYQLIDSQSEEVLAKGLCERIGIEGSSVTHQKAGEGKKTEAVLMKDHTDAVKVVIEKLTDPAEGVIASLKEIDAVGHRIVHGGEKFAQSVVITDEVIAAIEECNDLAPLHNPANLIGIRACRKLMPGVPNVGVFDTAFHQTCNIPSVSVQIQKIRIQMTDCKFHILSLHYPSPSIFFNTFRVLNRAV